jgi:hypothetical protein
MVPKMPATEIHDDDQAPGKMGLLGPRRPWQIPKVLSLDVASTKLGHEIDSPDGSPFIS